MPPRMIRCWFVRPCGCGGGAKYLFVHPGLIPEGRLFTAFTAKRNPGRFLKGLPDCSAPEGYWPVSKVLMCFSKRHGKLVIIVKDRRFAMALAKSVSVSINPELFSKLSVYCLERGCSRSWLINKAIER